MKKFVFLLVLSLLMAGFIMAQDYKGKGRVKGSVSDEEGNPIEGVKVKLFSVKAGQGFHILTDAKGIWKASWIRNGQWNVDFEKIGYEIKKINMQISEFKRNPDIDVVLKKTEGHVVSNEIQEELKQGNQLFDDGEYEAAVAVYQKMVEENADLYVIHKNIGNCYFKQEKYELAVESFLKVLDKAPGSTDILLSVGNCYANQGENEKAMEWYYKIEFEKIDDPTVLYNIGTNFYNSSQFEDALKYYKKAVELKSDFLDSIYQLGLCYLTTGSNEEAIAAFEDYLRMDPDSGRASQVKGFIEHLKKKDLFPLDLEYGKARFNAHSGC